MIISHKHKFIFIKTSKTAGTSIELALSKYCGSEDIISPFRPADEELRRTLKCPGPQNYFVPKSRYSPGDWWRFLYKGERLEFGTHFSAKHIRNYIDEEVWNSYFKFCFVRNPWDRMISYYYWNTKKNPHRCFSEWFNTGKPTSRLDRYGVNLYTINGDVVVDKIFYYENLTEDLEKIRLRFGFPEKLTLPRAKASYRKDRRSYREFLNKEQAEKIREWFSKEIALFGYEF